ncbi:MAG: helix-turn-helix transcriptional regulator [gamma proteobacterium endosymbiont of Lamellibrachia anaximandri]|nr:helix-turn-helix transcriptional regulator [gamma proteobacterium endosymbiont of Lamellibrachia anaximandri]
MTQDDRYKSNSQQRIVKILLFLGGHEVNGLAPGEIANGLSITPNNVTHDLANLRLAGVAEQLPESGRWRLTPRVPQIAMAMLNGISRAESKTNEVKNRFTRNPHS